MQLQSPGLSALVASLADALHRADRELVKKGTRMRLEGRTSDNPYCVSDGAGYSDFVWRRHGRLQDGTLWDGPGKPPPPMISMETPVCFDCNSRPPCGGCPLRKLDLHKLAASTAVNQPTRLPWWKRLIGRKAT